jgi:hypothetical protein
MGPRFLVVEWQNDVSGFLSRTVEYDLDVVGSGVSLRTGFVTVNQHVGLKESRKGGCILLAIVASPHQTEDAAMLEKLQNVQGAMENAHVESLLVHVFREAVSHDNTSRNNDPQGTRLDKFNVS